MPSTVLHTAARGIRRAFFEDVPRTLSYPFCRYSSCLAAKELRGGREIIIQDTGRYNSQRWERSTSRVRRTHACDVSCQRFWPCCWPCQRPGQESHPKTTKKLPSQPRRSSSTRTWFRTSTNKCGSSTRRTTRPRRQRSGKSCSSRDGHQTSSSTLPRSSS